MTKCDYCFRVIAKGIFVKNGTINFFFCDEFCYGQFVEYCRSIAYVFRNEDGQDHSDTKV